MHAWMHVLPSTIREAEFLFQDWLTIGVQRFLERRNSDFTGEVGGCEAREVRRASPSIKHRARRTRSVSWNRHAYGLQLRTRFVELIGEFLWLPGCRQKGTL